MDSTSGIPLVESTSGIYQWFSINSEGFLRFWGFLEDVGPRNDIFPWADAMFPVVFGNAWISNGNGMLFCGNGGNDVIWALENQCFWNANADLQNHHYSIRNITVFVNQETQADWPFNSQWNWSGFPSKLWESIDLSNGNTVFLECVFDLQNHQ